MRTIDEIRADLKIVEAAYIQPSPTLSFAIEDLATDFTDMLDARAEKDAEIERLNGDRASIIKANTCPRCLHPLTDLADTEDPDWVIGKQCLNCCLTIDEMGEHNG